jgi:methyl-accepting chemotaxis protein
MNIRSKLLLGGTAIALIPLLLATYLVAQTAYTTARESLDSSEQERLIATRENKKAQVEEYLNSLVASTQAISRSTTAIDALKSFKQNAPVMAKELGGEAKLATYRASLTDYYTKEFANAFAARNISAPKDMATLVGNLDAASVYFFKHQRRRAKRKTDGRQRWIGIFALARAVSPEL